ncbi:MAPEG family protein [Puniceibacterium sp. IMCC21224]|uniref:MAPEG family protein n=1 Tax=Puniceibacterium sp. IMCC21224 TaxID=1618204 RepID=UPI00064DA6AF|nr:MAPEG family protein [Puniceibacterium sp. IMCC21224]KMK67068.1 hypothetical protein IMCC21224_111931 [Puniceibacterium sp. IMCC21224]
MGLFPEYSHAIASLAVWALIVIVLSGVSISGKAVARCDCGKPRRDYADPVYRRDRAFQNALETSAPFLAATIAAILAGAPPFWVNLMASIFVVSRVAMAVVHIGTEIQPLRSAFYGISWLCILVTAILTFVAVF